ncbi:MAG: hypothetical protein ACO20H_01745 [Bacteriovoracaceae bacterium]
MALNVKAFYPLPHPEPRSEVEQLLAAKTSNEKQKKDREKDDRPHERPAYRIYQEAILGLDPFLASRLKKINEHTQD